ncbi:MAG: hypothetical protein ABSF69_02780 [Polyangiaceae bacterium]
MSFDLAFDPRSLAIEVPAAPTSPIVLEARLASVAPRRAFGPDSSIADDVSADARLLGDYGEPPTRWIQAALYAWRVYRRRRELRQSLAVRLQEVAQAQAELENGLVGFADQARPIFEDHPAYAESVDQLRRAEEVLDARIRVLAAENEADAARLASIDARIAKLEAEKEQARHEERLAASELAEAQAELGREELLLKRAESERRAALHRQPDRTSE